MVDILHRVGIKAPLNEVYQALATREGAAAWWTTNTQGDSKVGGVLKFRFSAEGKPPSPSSGTQASAPAAAGELTLGQ